MTTGEQGKNSYGLYDAPVPGKMEEPLFEGDRELSQEEIQEGLEQGAFFMSREEALRTGFLNPYEEETASVTESEKSEPGRNSYGLYDAPIPGKKEPSLFGEEMREISPEEIQSVLNQGAFFMPKEEALRTGFMSPYEEGSCPNTSQE